MEIFKLGDIVMCINTDGWGCLWMKDKPFEIKSEIYLQYINSIPEDFKLIKKYKKPIQTYGIVKFMKETSK